jgi:ubiquinone/menaquinone biosynthesis C-methylase UbiE
VPVLSDGWRISSQQALRSIPGRGSKSLFERFSWLYAFWREHLFYDHTSAISDSLWQNHPVAGTKVLEVGCGPGFYACRLAQKFPQIELTGIDRSVQLLKHAKSRAATQSLQNCHFVRGDFCVLDDFALSFDAVIASRIFTIEARREAALGEIHRTLKPGGRCFIAEPRSILRATVPLSILWFLARALRGLGLAKESYCEPARAVVLSREEFRSLAASQPWETLRVWDDAHYHYAVCEKASLAV